MSVAGSPQGTRLPGEAARSATRGGPTSAPLLQIENLTIQSVASQVPVVRGVSLSVAPGEILAIIGESGSGKTTVCLAALGHVRPGLSITEGRVQLAGADLFTLPLGELRALRGRRVAYVAQSAAASFRDSSNLEPSPEIMEELVSSSRRTGTRGSIWNIFRNIFSRRRYARQLTARKSSPEWKLLWKCLSNRWDIRPELRLVAYLVLLEH